MGRLTNRNQKSGLRSAINGFRTSSKSKGWAWQEGGLFEPFCERYGLIPNKNRVIDEGLLAYHGLHYRKNNLGGFLQARRDSLIPAGQSWL